MSEHVILVHSGRDAEVETVTAHDANSEPSRCVRVARVLQPHCETRILGLDDWKGTLTIVWNSAPSLTELDYAKQIWYAEDEATICHYYKALNGTMTPIDIEYMDTSAPPEAYEAIAARLGLKLIS